MKKRGVLFLAILSGILLTACSRTGMDSAKDANAVFIFEGIPYVGSFSEADQEEDGAMLFEVEDQTAQVVSAEGIWENGNLTGEAKVTLRDQSVIQVKYKRNEASGEAKRSYPDGSYAEYRCRNGYPSGRVLYYDSNDQMIGVDRYYSNKLIAEWCALSEEIDYAGILKDPESFYKKPVRFQGRVTDVLDDAESRYIVVENADKQTVICKYENTDVSSPQALVADVAVNDMVTVYGLFDACDTLSIGDKYASCTVGSLADEQIDLQEYVFPSSVFYRALLPVKLHNLSLYSTLPFMELLYVDVQGREPFDYGVLDEENAKQYEYDLLLSDPYLFCGFKLKETAQVRQISIDYDEQRMEMLLQKESGNQLYYAVLDMEESEEFPGAGESISFEATLEGWQKLERRTKKGDFDEATYVLIPAITIDTVD